jgi:hypothetical protein
MVHGSSLTLLTKALIRCKYHRGVSYYLGDLVSEGVMGCVCEAEAIMCINLAGKEEGKRPIEGRDVVKVNIEMHVRIARCWYTVSLGPLVNTALFFAFNERDGYRG